MNSKRIACSLVPTILLVAALAAPAGAFTTIDDFEVGSCYEETGDTLNVLQPLGPSGSGHVISSNRRILFEPSPTVGGLLRASIDSGPGTIGQMQLWAETGYGNNTIEWDWGIPSDITEGGAVDTICMEFSIAPGSGMNVSIRFTDVNGLHGIGRTIEQTSGGNVIYRFPLSDWGTIDMTQLVAFEMKFHQGARYRERRS